MRRRMVSAAAAVACVAPSILSTTPAVAATADPQVIDSSSVCVFVASATCSTTLTFDSAVTAWGNVSFNWDNPNLSKTSLSSATPKANTKTLTFTWRVVSGITPMPDTLSIASWSTSGYITKVGSATGITLPLLSISNSKDVPIAPPAAPATPTSSNITPTGATISWDASTDPSVTKYEIYQDGVLFSTTTETTATAAGLKPATTHTYTIKAVNVIGKSAASEALSVTTLSAPPSTPTRVGLAGVTSNSAVINWAESAANGSPITEYRVYKDGAIVATTQGTSATITGLAASSNYTFTVKAVSAIGTSNSSAGLAVTTPAVGAASTIPRIETANTTCSFAVTKYCTTILTFDMPVTVWGTSTFTLDNTNLAVASLSTASKRANTTSLTYTYRVNKTVAAPETLAIKAWSPTGYITKSPNGAAMSLPLISVLNYIAPPAIPLAPTAVAAGNTTATSTVLSWVASSNIKTAPTTYEIYQNGILVATTPAGANSYTVTGLTPATTSVFTVKAVNAGGTSETSTSATVSTSSAPPARPAAPTADAVTPTSATISWPAPAANGSAITEYEIYQDGVLVGTSTNTSYTATGLAPGSSYSFAVKAVNGLGSSAEGTSLTVTTDPAAPAAPVAPVAGDKTASSIDLTWDAPVANGSAITGYEVYANGAYVGASTGTTHTVIGLAPGTSYDITIKAINAIGASIASPALTVVTNAVAPSAPLSVTATPDVSKMTVAWAAPVSNGGATITEYTVTANTGETCTTSSLTCDVTGLTYGNDYTFTVKANNSVGAGTASAATTADQTLVSVTGGDLSCDTTTCYVDVKSTGSSNVTVTGGDLPVDYAVVGGGGAGSAGESKFHEWNAYYHSSATITPDNVAFCFTTGVVCYGQADGNYMAMYNYYADNSLTVKSDGAAGGGGQVKTGTTTLASGNNYAVTVGNGGQSSGNSGEASSAFGVTANGGGFGSLISPSGYSGSGNDGGFNQRQMNLNQYDFTNERHYGMAKGGLGIGAASTYSYLDNYKWSGRIATNAPWGGGQGYAGYGNNTYGVKNAVRDNKNTWSTDGRTTETADASSISASNLDTLAWAPEYDAGSGGYTYSTTVGTGDKKFSTWSGVRWGRGVTALGLKVGGGGMAGVNARTIDESYGGGYGLNSGSYTVDGQANTGGGGGGIMGGTSVTTSKGGSGVVRIAFPRSAIYG